MRKTIQQYGLVLAALACFVFGSVQAADKGLRHHARGEYDTVTATYVVVEGDELIAISERFEIPVADLKAQNQLSSNELNLARSWSLEPPALPAHPNQAVQDDHAHRTGRRHTGQDRDFHRHPEPVRRLSRRRNHRENLRQPGPLTRFAGVSVGHPHRQPGRYTRFYAQIWSDNQTDVIWEDLVDSKTVELTANDNTIYSFIWLDTHKGPVVMEVPPMSLGAIDDFWYRWVTDIGITGPDKGKGGKYLVLPPGYKGEIPEGYFVVRPSTYGNWAPFRTFLVMARPSPELSLSKGH